MEACGVGGGDVVITSPYTFTSTAEVARYLGADVAFVDVIPGSYLIDPAPWRGRLSGCRGISRLPSTR
jgi:dTDP-4-amino-4,6-dideoxygalactose transaminase